MNILLAIAIPILAAFILLATGKNRRVSGFFALSAAIMSAACAIYPTMGDTHVIFPWLGGVFDFSLKVDGMAALTLFVSSFMAIISVSYALMSKVSSKELIPLLLLQGCSAGFFAADSLAVMAFFAGIVPFIMMIAPFDNYDSRGRGIACGGSRLSEKTTPSRDSYFIAGMSLFICLMAGVAITGYISGTMTISEIASARLTLEYGWSATAFLLISLPAFYLMGIYPFSLCKEEISSHRPIWFNAYSAPMGVLIGALMLIRADHLLFNPGYGVRLALFFFGIITAVIAAIRTFAESARDVPDNLLVANAGLMASAIPFAESLPGSLFMLLALPGLCGFMLSMCIDTSDSRQYTAEGMARAAGAVPVYSKNTAARNASFVFTLLFLAYSWAYAGLPPFGDGIRQIMAGMAKHHKPLFLVVCAVQALICSGLIKNFFAVIEENESLKNNDVRENVSNPEIKTSEETGLCQPVLAGIPLLLLLCCGFGGTMAENIAIIPTLESIGLDMPSLLRGSGIVYITFTISFLAAFILFQSAEAVSESGAADAGNFINDASEKIRLSKPSFHKFLSFVVNPVNFLNMILKMIVDKTGTVSKTAKNKSILNTTLWKWPSDIISEISDFCTPITESSINFSLAAAITLAAIFTIIAAAGGFN